MSVPPPRLHLSRITKAYPGVVANDAVDLVVQPGEIHAVLGENGAGKSTLMKIIYGAVQPDSGGMAVDGRSVHLSSPQQARALGIAMVFQPVRVADRGTERVAGFAGTPYVGGGDADGGRQGCRLSSAD